ncbi:MAG TPA: hypothetical protein DD473_06080 [Planctomycetaceae bacterium]|nr:hypothetical protein [Planctomycetaceae bacterium]|tara:strand:- start:1960 stop:2319 length:360 start_codon:yes stop_codon:yes gene_type:complete
MSLLVHTFTRGPDGAMNFVEPAEQWQELAGFEDYRWKVYSSLTAKSIGMHILPTLVSSDIYVEGKDVVLLLAETELALANIDAFATEAQTTPKSLRPGLQNIVNACHQASKIGGGVVIW